MSFESNYLKLRAEREKKTTQPAGDVKSPAGSKKDSFRSSNDSFTSGYLALRNKRESMSIAERAEERVRLLKQQGTSYQTGSILRNSPSSKGYYSPPAFGFGGAGEQLYSNITAMEPVLKEKLSALDTARASLVQSETDLQTVRGYLEQAREAYNADPSEVNATSYNQIAGAYNLAHDSYSAAFKAYSAAYDDYKPYEEEAINALTLYQLYGDNQQELFDHWRGTIRDAETIQNDIATIDQKIVLQEAADKASAEAESKERIAQYEAQQKEKPWYEKMLGYLGETQDTNLPMAGVTPGTIQTARDEKWKKPSAEMQSLLDAKKLLEEELDWSRYYYYTDYSTADDFEAMSKYVPQEQTDRRALDIILGNYSDDASGWEDPLYEYINGNEEAGAYLSNAGANYYGSDNPLGSIFGRITESKSESQQMDDPEIAIFNYLYATQGKAAAHAYYNYLQKDLNYRQRKADEKQWKLYASEHPGAASVFSVAVSPLKGLSYLGQLSDIVGTGTIDENAGYNKFSYVPSAIRGQVVEQMEAKGNWGKVGSFAYQTGLSMADFLLTTAITGGNSTAALTIMGSGAAADTTLAAKDRGLEDWQAFTLGTVAGIAEALTEKVSLDTLLDADLLKDGALRYVLKNAFAEGSEEVASSTLNLMADVIVSKDRSEWWKSIEAYTAKNMDEDQAFARAMADQALSLGVDFLGGFISGGVMGGGGAVIGNVNTKKIGTELGKLQLSDEDIRAFIDTGLASDPDTASYQLAKEMQAKIEAGEKLSNNDLARLYKANVLAIQAEEESSEDLPTIEEKSYEGEVSAKTLLQQAQADYRAGNITEAEFDAIIDEVMHLEELEDGNSDFSNHPNTVADDIEEPIGLQLPSLETDPKTEQPVLTGPQSVTATPQNVTPAQANDTVLPTGVPLSVADQLRMEQAQNGGTQYESTQRTAAGPAASQYAGGPILRGGAGISDGSAERNVGAGTAEQTGVLASSPEQRRSAYADRSRATVARQNYARSLRLEKVSSLDLGLQNGTEARNIQIVPQEYWDSEMAKLDDRIYNETGKRITFVMGRIQIRGKNGSVSYARGVITGERIIVQADHLRVPMEQIADHEAYHAKVDFSNGRLNDEIRRHILETFSEEQFQQVLEKYIECLRGIININEARTSEEYEAMVRQIEEEVFADAYAGINAFGAGADQFTGTVNEKMDQLYMGKIRNQDNGTEESTGPPSDRYSFAGENANNADLDALARAKEMQAAGVADETIRQQTGWFTGMDGKWRWEIDDSGMEYSSRGDLGLQQRRPEYARYRELLDKANRHALELSDEALTPEETAELQKLKNIWSGTFRKAGRITEDALPTELLSDYVKHDALFEAYPQLRKTRLRFADLPEGTRGQYDPEQDIITLSNKLRGKPQDTLIHEIQHVIQKAEGFGGGASVEYWTAKLATDRQREVELADKKYREIFASMPEELKNKVRAYNRANLDYDYDEAIAIENELLESEYGELFSAYQDADFERRNLRERYESADLTEDAITNYWNTAGEIEARDAASRRQLTVEQRRNTAPARADDHTVFVEDVDDFGLQLGDRYSADDTQTYAEIQERQQELRQRELDLQERKRAATSNPELLQAMDEYSSLFTEMRGLLPKRRNGTATQAELDRIEEIKTLRDEYMQRIADLQESLGLAAISQEETEIREEKEALRVASDAAWAREGSERENMAIEKAGLSPSEYFRRKAVKAFKTTTNFNEAGYLLPDGKLLNFSGGERNHRYRDHREIGEIYEATNGVAALNRFLADGNIRIMAESPGADLPAGVEPTREQYAALRKFINSNGVQDGRFFVDFSNADGSRAGNYAYEGRIYADRVINDIKHYYATGETVQRMDLNQFRYSVDDDAYLEAVNSGDMETAQQMVDAAAERWGAYRNNDEANEVFRQNGRIRIFYHGTNTGDFTTFDNQLLGSSSGDLGWFGKGFYFAFSHDEASTYGGRVIPAYLRMRNPYDYSQLYKFKGSDKGATEYARFAWVYNITKQFPDIAEGQHVWAYPNDAEEGSAVRWKQLTAWMDRIQNEKHFFVEKVELSNGDTAWELRADPRKESFTTESGKTFEWTEYGMRQLFATEQDANEPINQIGAYLKNVMGIDSIPRRTIEKIDFSGALQRAGYDGILQSMSGDEAVVFSPEQIKSSEPVTYDDNGNVIPLSKRFSSSNQDIRFSADDMDGSGANGLRENMTTKEREILRGVEARLLRNIGGALSATKFGDRSYLKSVIQGLSDTYLESGTIEQQAMDDLFEQAYRQGIVVDRELHDQYEEVRKYLHTVSLTLDPRDRSDIADYPDFVKRMRGRMRIVNEGGLPVDSAWHELNDMAPELFPDSIAHPADQLVRMTEVLDSLRIAEKSLSDYYGPMASTYKKDAKAEFERAVWESIGELRQIRRFEQERQQKLQEAEPAPTTPEEAMEAWAKLKTARKTYEKAMAKNLLTTEDEIAVGELLKGKLLPEHLDKDNLNVKGILAVYEAKQEYEHLTKLLAEYRRKVKADIRAEADTYLETANTWKDKDIGLLYSREIMQRNVEDIVPDKKLAKQINERYFEPVRDAEAAAVKMKEGYREAVRKLSLSRNIKKGNLVSEAHAVQLYGEAMDNIRILEKARGRLKHRGGKSLEEWRGVVYKLWQENPGLDKAKIESAVAEMRQIYDELFRKMNEVRVRWGYEPVNYRQGYFPHFQPGDGDGIIAQFGRVLGIDTQVVALPTTINGLTHTFKPGIQWFGNAQERLGFNTTYDAVEGFDRYIEGVASVICQTENIQRLRALASQIRYRTSDEGIRKQVDAIYSNAALTEEQKNDAISGIYEKGRYTLSNFVVEVDEYTNLLANKKSKLDRTVEALIGRKFYTAMKWLESHVGANMIAGNVTSALTNFIPLTQASAQLSKRAMLQGMWDTLTSYKTDDGIIDRSAFLTNRRGSDPLVKVWSAKVSEVLGKPMELIDSFTSGSIVRAAYHQNLKLGLSESEAMHQADIFASRVMAERSKGGMPTLFESKNPFFKLFTQFQLEVNNQWSEVFKDIPRLHREKGLATLALIFLQYFLGAWLFNNLYEKWIGRRPAMDPIDIVFDTVKDFASDDVSTTDALGNLANNVLEELPFSSALTLIGIETDGGRVPVSSGIPNIPTLVTAATNEDWAPKKRWEEAQDELNKLAYVIPPFGGNQVSKIWKGIKAYIEGGSYSVDSDGNDILQYPVYNDESGDFWGLVQAMLLGKSSLPEAKEWVEDGFDSLSAKQTAVYQDMIDSGISEREAYDLIDSLRSASETEDASKEEVQIGILQDADAGDECKAIAFYGLLATDNERLLMDSLTDSGAMPGPVMDVLIQLRDATALPSAEEKVAQTDILIGSALTESEKEIVIRSWLDDQELNESGNLTSLGKFNLAMKQGITTEEYLRYRATGMEIDKLLEYTEAGFEADEAQDLAQAIHDLDPLPDEDRVSTLRKWRASVDFSDDVENQLAALSAVMTDAQLQKVEIANNFGVSPDAYVTLQEIKSRYDADGNGSYKNTEIQAAIEALPGYYTTEQKAALWQLTSGSTSAKNNPYSQQVGNQILEAKNTAKKQTALTSDDTDSDSFSQEILKQLLGRG